MLRVFVPDQPDPLTDLDAMAGALPPGAVWIDMITPTREEEAFIEAATGIATGRLHARGPVGLEELTIYKTRVTGTGQIRP